MVYSEVVRTWLPFIVATDLLVVLPLLAAATVVALVRRSHRAAWLGYAAAGAVGLALGFLVLGTSDRPALRVAILVAIAVLAVVATIVGERPARGGVLIVAAAIPWLVFDAAILADVAFLGRRMIDPSGTVLSLAVAAVAAVVGVSLIVAQRQWDARHPRPVDPTPVDPPGRRWDVVARLTFGADHWWSPPRVGSLVGLLLGTWLTTTMAHGRPPLQVVVIGALGVVVSTVAYTLGFAIARTPGSRRALEPFVWASERALERLETVAGGRIGASRRAILRYVRNTAERPEDRWIRVEVLVATGDVVAAREMADRMPEGTPFERVERAGARTWVSWLEGGAVDLANLAAAVAAVEPVDGDERLEAEITLAAAQVRVRASDGVTDLTAPLRAVGDRLGPRAWRARRAFVARVFSSAFWVSAALVGIVLILDRVQPA